MYINEQTVSNMSAIYDPIPIQSNSFRIQSDIVSNVNTSMPISITPKRGTRSPDTHIGTCRSYDETQVVPSFGRFWGNELPSKSKKSAKKLFGESPKGIYVLE